MVETSRQQGIESSPVGKIFNNRPTSFADPKTIDRESDGTLISAYASVQRFVTEYITRSKDKMAFKLTTTRSKRLCSVKLVLSYHVIVAHFSCCTTQ